MTVTMTLVDEKQYPSLASFAEAQLAENPEMVKFITRRLASASSAELDFLEYLSKQIQTLAGNDTPTFIRDYAWLCQMQLEEELHFRRHGQYRLSRFQDAYEQVYSNREFMTRYMNGLLITQLWWSNHTAVMRFYRDRFLATNPHGYSHLEVGPGHGLLLYMAAADPRCGDVYAWDISEASMALTDAALKKLGNAVQPTYQLQDLFDNPQGSFDSIVFCEVLEHMEKPAESLQVLRSCLSPRGRLFINMPINSPAPDHLFNQDSPEDLVAFTEAQGLKVVDSAFFPATNQTLEAARKKKLTINCALILEAT